MLISLHHLRLHRMSFFGIRVDDFSKIGAKHRLFVIEGGLYVPGPRRAPSQERLFSPPHGAASRILVESPTVLLDMEAQ
jgi:hypothetical protein